MIGELLIALAWMLAWLCVSQMLTEQESATCPRCGERLVQGLETSTLYCVRCRCWQR